MTGKGLRVKSEAKPLTLTRGDATWVYTPNRCDTCGAAKPCLWRTTEGEARQLCYPCLNREEGPAE